MQIVYTGTYQSRSKQILCRTSQSQLERSVCGSRFEFLICMRMQMCTQDLYEYSNKKTFQTSHLFANLIQI